jgi:hypothetical protein
MSKTYYKVVRPISKYMGSVRWYANERQTAKDAYEEMQSFNGDELESTRYSYKGTDGYLY